MHSSMICLPGLHVGLELSDVSNSAPMNSNLVLNGLLAAYLGLSATSSDPLMNFCSTSFTMS